MKAAKMQFGRIYGIGLIVLGLVLLVLQFVHYMTPPKEVGPTQTETRTVRNTQHLTSSWPGFIGAGSLVAGIALFITARRKRGTESEI
jgi:protein-S-isoprenylcysteine O-methyltransferase Ste14